MLRLASALKYISLKLISALRNPRILPCIPPLINYSVFTVSLGCHYASAKTQLLYLDNFFSHTFIAHSRSTLYGRPLPSKSKSGLFSFLDEGIGGSEPNTVSLRREIAVLDENDNAPVYHGRPYAARVPESARVGGLLLAPGTILVTDRDGGVNADVDVSCVPATRDDDACRVFDVTTQKVR